MKKQCKQCNIIFDGRKNKDFCSITCKSAFNNEQARQRNRNLKVSFDRIKANRNILMGLHQLFGADAIGIELLERAGFQPAFTSVQSNQNVLIYDDWGLKQITMNQFQIIKL